MVEVIAGREGFLRSGRPHRTQNWQLRKPGAESTGGIVVSQSGEAAAIGAEILADGGNAVDAAIATAFALTALEPWNSGLGGIGFMTVHRAGERRAEIVDFGPIAPAGLDPSAFPLTGETRTELFTWPRVVDDRNMHGPLSFVIPSAVAGYAAAVERFGRLPLRRLIEPAVGLARRGHPVDWFTTLKVASAAANLRRYEESRRIWLPGDLPPVAPPEQDDHRLTLGRLAATLERLAEAGSRDFYEGEIARAIIADVAEGGGILSSADLAGCRARFRAPLQIPYRGTVFQTAPGVTAGPTLDQVLARLGRHSFGPVPDRVYFCDLAEALANAYADRLAGLGDTEAASDSCTTHISVVDREGTIVSLTTTLLSVFGSRYVLPSTGILMNNGVMWFDPRPGSPNAIGPGKRALCNMCPVVVARDGRPEIGVGASGGRRILAAVVQLASFVVDFGMTPEEAGHHPRIDVSGTDGIALDQRLPPEILGEFGRLPGAFAVEHRTWPARFACPNLVVRGSKGINRGISDVMSPWSAAVAETLAA